MGAYLDLTAANAALKEHYDEQKLLLMTYAKNPTLALLPKDEESGGKYRPIPIWFEVNQGRSATFSYAQGNQTPNQYAEFLLTRKSDYDIATIDNQTLEASMSSVDAFLEQSTALIDGAIRGCTLSASSSLFRSGTGTIGQNGSITTGVITLTNPGDVVQFAVGQTLQAATSDGGAPRAAVGYVIGRSIRNGTVTVSATAQGGAAGTPASWAANDFLLVQGDSNNKFSGLPAWLPMTDPTSTDNFYGVNRSVDYRLFGVNYDGSGQPIEEALVDHSLLLAREGASSDLFITNYGSYSAVMKALGTRREYIDMQSEAGISFRAVSIDGVDGPIKMLSDRNCQVKSGFMLQSDTWKLCSLGPVPKILRYEDRVEMLRVYNADAAECRVAYYANLGCGAPGFNGQNLLSA